MFDLQEMYSFAHSFQKVEDWVGVGLIVSIKKEVIEKSSSLFGFLLRFNFW